MDWKDTGGEHGQFVIRHVKPIPQEAGRRREDSAPDLSFAPDDNGILGFLDHTSFKDDIMTPWHPPSAWPTNT